MLLAIASIVIGIEVSAATASSATAPSVETVNRAQKGDRLLVVPTLHQNAISRPREVNLRRAPAADQDLADGCESLASPLSHSPLAQIAGRLRVLGEDAGQSPFGDED